MSTQHFNVLEHVFPAQYIREYANAVADDQEVEFRLHVKRYVPKDIQGPKAESVTIIGAHANGFPKELYEPLWDDLYDALKARGISVYSIWIADSSHQGTSGHLNEEILGNDPSWDDHSRDLLLMINHFRGEMPRPIIGIGHSMGAVQMLNLALIHPRLLYTLVLIEPVLHRKIAAQDTNDAASGPAVAGILTTRLSTYRRDLWATRTGAAESFKRSRFYQTWDPRVLELWIRFGLRDLPTAVFPASLFPAGTETQDKPVTLSTTRHQEVFSFLRPNYSQAIEPQTGKRLIDRQQTPDLDLDAEISAPFYRPECIRTFTQLEHIRPSVLFIQGAKSDVSPPSLRAEILKQTGAGIGGSGGVGDGKVKQVVLEHGGHLLPMEDIGDVVNASAPWLEVEIYRWRQEEAAWKASREGMSQRQKSMINKEWEERIGAIPRKEKANL